MPFLGKEKYNIHWFTYCTLIPKLHKAKLLSEGLNTCQQHEYSTTLQEPFVCFSIFIFVQILNIITS